MSDEKIELANEIDKFIEAHAGISPNYDPEYDEPGDRFTGPDSSMLYQAACALREDLEYPYVHSDWGSGTYHDYHDKTAQAWHDDLVSRVNGLRISLSFR